jgi:predicted nucleic acid-binding protein
VIVVDTSVWVESTRVRGTAIRKTLQALIEADEVALALPVRLELASGLAHKDRGPFMRALTALPLLVPTEDTWRLVEGWIAPGSDKGHRFAVTDLLIAGLTHEIGALVWSLDDDFGRLAKLGYVRQYSM